MSGQLQLEFVESPSGHGASLLSSVLAIGDALRHKSSARKAPDTATTASDTSRLLEEVASEANLAEALLHVVRNKGAPGVDGESVDEVLAQADGLLPQLSRELLTGRFRPNEIKRVWIPKPGGGERGLGIPTVVDRWVQQAIHQVLVPLWEPRFHNSSHGFRPGRGAKTAIPEAQALVNAGKDWVVSIDLSKFFDRVNHQRLMARLAQRVHDKRLLRLIHQMLKARIVLPDGLKMAVAEGTPQGGPLSPLLSNIVLDELDWELERRNLAFVRYADDVNVFVRSERAGARVMEGLTRFVERRLRLKVNEDKTVVDKPERVHILGFSLRRNTECGKTEILLSNRTVTRLRSKVKELTPRNWGQSLDELFRQANIYLNGWMGYFCLCSEGERTTLSRIDAHLRRRVRCIVLKRHKSSLSLCRHLTKRGVQVKTATKSAYGRAGLWRKSVSRGMHLAYPTKWFLGKVTNLAQEWLRINRPPTTETASGQLLLAL